MEKHSPHLSLAHAYWQEHLRAEDTAIDATCGNGHDTAWLAGHLASGLTIGLDLQQCAIDKTASHLRSGSVGRVALYRMCHADIDRIPLPSPPRLIVYNLGYLPGGDKTIVTQTATTLQSLEKAIHLLAPDGAISATCYPGHPEGEMEEKAILRWAGQLPYAKWQVCHHRWINRAASPSLLWIRRLAPEFRAGASHRS